MAQNEIVLNKLLVQIAKEQNFGNYVIKIEPIYSGGANYTSALYNVTVTEGDNVVHMFAKVAIIGEKLRSGAPRMYEIEGIAYTKVLKAYERLQDEHQVPREHRLTFSKFYGYNPTVYEETIVMENLVMQGYQSYDRFKSVDWEYAKSALREVAKMHALAFAYDEYYSDEFNAIIKELKSKWVFEGVQAKAYLDGVYLKAEEVTQQKNKDKLRRYIDEVNEDIFDKIYGSWGRRAVLGHGDYRPSNLLHRVGDDGTIDIKIVDLQTMQGSSPVMDLLYFIFTGSDEQFRAQYYEKLLDHYYTQLHAAMKRLHLDPDKVYSRDEFDHELKEKLPFGLTIAALTLPAVTVDLENAPQMSEDAGLSAFSVQNTSDLYAERMNGVVNDYVRWGVLK